jgi:hypothetical protein
MYNLPNGAYNYYPPLSPTIPVVVQVDRDIVWFAGDEQYRMLAKCSGRFVRLQECPLDEDKVAQEPVCYAPV